MKIRSFLTSAALLITIGCATGKQFSLDRASSVRVGMTTNELVAAMGSEPMSVAPVRTDLTGKVVTKDNAISLSKTPFESWIWSYDSGFKRQIAAFVVSDGKVVQVPPSLVRSKREESIQQSKSIEELNGLVADRRAADQAARSKAAQDAREAFVAAHSELPEKVRQSILKQSVCLGMPADAVEISWGPPSSKQKSTGRFGTSEIWRYGSWVEAPLVFLDNGKVTGWHTSE